MKRIIFVVPSLKAGGAERVMSFLAENLNPKKFKVILIVVGHQKDQVYQTHESRIDIKFLERNRISKAFRPLFKEIRKQKPDIVISSIGHLNTLMSVMAFFIKKPAFIAREANIDRVRKTFNPTKGKLGLRLNLKRIGYRFLKIIICQSQDMYDSFTEEYPQFKTKTVIINNPITDKFKLKSNKDMSDIIQFITVGSLHSRKGHSRILKTLAKFELPFTYTIVGNGERKDELFELANSLGISEKITHVPFTKEVDTYLCASDFYLQGSYVEGFPNAVIESCAVGTPVLAFDAPGGINEIIENGVNGHISTSEEDFLKNLHYYAKNNQFKSHIVRDSVIRKYGKEIILNKFEALFTKII
ncbi:glycosyltransferase [Flagellimonas sp. CMM7]|uniref:glycosyltransferase n=1 Tax=Flagellimonas sp. CMM7 TaxID=2654676 RepID=UPI0013D50516|nr:glycosyltransferase [Flagellimonas sp. CMM7]UII79913.1 glycosyltransferase [Flagellimonas sp. CMM7]